MDMSCQTSWNVEKLNKKHQTDEEITTTKCPTSIVTYIIFWAFIGAIIALSISRQHCQQDTITSDSMPFAASPTDEEDNVNIESAPKLPDETPISQDEKRRQCRDTCKLEVVESIPVNVTFGRDAYIPTSTFEAWLQLIDNADSEILIAAYKSSLRGKHVLGSCDAHHSAPGEVIFDELLEAGSERNVKIRMVENFPPKDRGDNADGQSLQRKGAVHRRSLHFSKLFGAGTMHSKFLVVDQKHLYLGSANLDWRSLNQKMELGVLLWNCPCFARDLTRIFSSYWNLTRVTDTSGAWRDNMEDLSEPVIVATAYNQHSPLEIVHGGVPTMVYLAASPLELNGPGRTWDLDAILNMINNAQEYVYIHVMDYIPMIVYREPQRYWPVIDDAIRRAVVEREVEVKLLAAALHFVPQTLRFLKSLASVNKITSGSIQVKIFTVPTDEDTHGVLARERRTHNKFMVTESSTIIGTSNWSGDYFVGNTGVALVVTQNSTQERPFINQLRDIFVRDWQSNYAHTLTTYMKLCLDKSDGSAAADSTVCEVEKDAALFDSEQ